MKRVVLFFLALVFMFLSNTNASYSSTARGTIQSLGVGPQYSAGCDRGDCVYIKMTVDPPDQPPCKRQAWNYILDTSTPAGKTHFSALLAAFMECKSVLIEGKGTCYLRLDNEGVEDVNFLVINPFF